MKVYKQHKIVLAQMISGTPSRKISVCLFKIMGISFARYVLKQFQKDYKWLSQVYISVKPVPTITEGYCGTHLGAQTTKLIHEHIHVSGINHDMEEMVLMWK